MPHIKTGSSVSALKIDFDTDNNVFAERSKFILSYFIHYPKQLIRSTSLDRDALEQMVDIREKIIRVDNIEVFVQRNSRENYCLEESYQDDDLIQKRLVEQTGCRPSYWLEHGNYLKCTTFDQMHRLQIPSMTNSNEKFLKQFDENPGRPCNQVHSIAFTTKDKKPPTRKIKRVNLFANRESDPKSFVLEFKNPIYKEIKHVQAFDINSFVGNVGGYIGLFVGFSFWETPNLIAFLFEKMKVCLNKRFNVL